MAFAEVSAGSEAEIHCKPDELDARTDTELAVGIAHVRFDRMLADEETVADSTGRRPSTYHSQGLKFSFGEWLDIGRYVGRRRRQNPLDMTTENQRLRRIP